MQSKSARVASGDAKQTADTWHKLYINEERKQEDEKQ